MFIVALFVTGMGLLLTLGIDLSATHAIQTLFIPNPPIHSPDAAMVPIKYGRLSSLHKKADSAEEVTGEDHKHDDYCDSDDSDAKELLPCPDEYSCYPTDRHTNVPSVSLTRSLIKAYMLAGAVAVLSVIIGFGYGLLGEDDLSSRRVLGIAFLLHQFFEGVGVGVAVVEAKLPSRTAMHFALVFAFTFPLGAVVGFYTGNESGDHFDKDENSFMLWQGVANAVAAGTLLYTALVEMLPDEFSSHSHQHAVALSSSQQVGMFTALLMGFVLMSVIAIWA